MRKSLILNTVLLISTVFLSSCQPKPEVSPTPLGPGDTLPEFSVTDNLGNTVSDTLLKNGNAVIIHFNTWCPDCVKEMPELERIYRLHKDKARFIAIARGEGKEKVDPFMTAGEYTIPYACEPDRSVWSIFDRGAMKGVPAVYLSVKGGTIAGHWFSEDDINTLEIFLEKL